MLWRLATGSQFSGGVIYGIGRIVWLRAPCCDIISRMGGGSFISESHISGPEEACLLLQIEKESSGAAFAASEITFEVHMVSVAWTQARYFLQ